MTISFSGLASGLDTSQWIESLVALKRAKVNTLQTQKEEIVAQKDTLSAIKSFFASFRATVQKITDSKFGNTSMDLFASNIATSSNLNILSATVNQSAMEGIYKVKVDSLATKTTATSGFKDKVTTDSLATMGTKLTALGMSTGKVQIKKDDVTQSFQIESKDTIESLIGKFDKVGVEANYNTNTGIFSVDIGIENITDLGNTNIINALGLVNANQGYSGEKIEFYETVKVTATGSTLLKDIEGIDINGLDDSGGEIVVSNNLGEITTISVNDTTTIDNLCQAFENRGIGITFQEGKIYIEQSNILSENIGLIDALQVEETNGGPSTEVTTKELYVRKRADLNTTFGDLGLTSNAELVLRRGSSTTTTITINPTMSINNLFNSLESVTIGSDTYNIEGIIEDGIISLNTGATIIGFEGEVAELLGINNGTWKTIGIENTSTSTITYTKTATESTTLAELGYNGTYEVEIERVRLGPGGTSLVASPYATITVGGATTLDSLFNKLDDYGIEASISNGKISIEEQVGATVLVANTGSGLLKSLGITSTSTTAGTDTTVGTTLTSTEGVTITLSGTATEDCLLIGSGASSGQRIYYTLSANSTTVKGTFTVQATSTFGDLGQHMEDAWNKKQSFTSTLVTVTFDWGCYSLTMENGNSVKIDSGCNLLTTGIMGGKKLLDYGTTFAELGQTANITLDVYTTSGVKNVTINEDDTVGEALTKLSNYGITSSISDNGKLTISGSDNAYIMSDDGFNDVYFNAYFALGSSTHYKTIPNCELTYTDSNLLNVTKTLSGATTLGDLGINNNQTITVNQSGTTKTLTFTKTQSLTDVISQLSQKGITAKIQDGKFVIEASDAYISGISTTLKSELGLSNDFTNKVITSSKNYYLDHAEGYDLFNNLYTKDDAQIYDPSSFIGKKIMVYNGGNSTFEEIQFTSSIPSLNDFCQSLEAYGIQTNLNADGSIKFSSNVGSYLTTDGIETNEQSNILEKLGINNWLPLYEYQPNGELIQANQTNTLYATGTTFLNEIDSDFNEATLSGTIDGNDFGIVIKKSDSIDDILGKFNSLGISAIINESGEITISDGEKHLEINDFGGIESLLKLQVADNLGGYLESQNPLMEKTTTIKDISAFSYANSNTTMKDLGISDGMLTFYLDGEKHEFQIDAENKIKDLDIQLNVGLGDYSCSSVKLEFDENGYLNITSNKYNDIKVGAIGDTSNFVSVMRLENNEDGTVKSTKQFYNGDENSLLIKAGLFKYGALETGTFTIGGEEFEITNDTTLAGLIGEINSSEAANATAYWDANNAKLVIESRTSGSGYINIDRGTSNFTDLLGLTQTVWEGVSGSLNSSVDITSLVAESFGTHALIDSFKLGEHTITIDVNTTFEDLIDDINATGLMQAIWDDTSKCIKYTGTIPVDVEMPGEIRRLIFRHMYTGDNNGNGIQDICGNPVARKLNTDAQVKGEMAKFSINGTYYTSTLNTIDSSVHHIDGVTINLKGVSEDGGETTLTIERDKETLANAVSNLVDSYNTLIENIDKEISANSALANQTGLKMLKNQIRSLMTSSFIGGGSYNTLSQIGISTKTATAGDITTNGIDKLSFDKEKFIEAYNADSEGVKKLLLGTDDDKGVFWQLESIVDNAVSSTTGFFSTATNSYNKQVTRINDRITKTQKEVDTYKARLERKFSAMELLITQLQNQYSSFLGVGIQ